MSAEMALSDGATAAATAADEEVADDAFEDELGCCSGWQGQVLLLFFTSLFSK